MDQSVLQLSGAQLDKPQRHVPLYINRWFTGWVTQRSPFVQPNGRADYRYYGGRPDTLLDGVNMEVNNSGLLVRRPGYSPYTTALFPSPVLSGYSWFELTTDGDTNLFLMASTQKNVYTVTPTSITSIYSKLSGAIQTFFYGVGNFLYFGDGVSAQKWNGGNGAGNVPISIWGIATPLTAPTLNAVETGSSAVAWQANTFFSTMGIIEDSNSNLQQLISVNADGSNPNSQFGQSGNGSPAWNNTSGGTTVDNTITWTCQTPIGNTWTPNHLYFNSSNNDGTVLNPSAIYDPTSNAVYVMIAPASANGSSGTSKPPFNGVFGSVYLDSFAKWFCLGPINQWVPGTAYPAYISGGHIQNGGYIVEPLGLPPYPTNQTLYLQTSSGGTSNATAVTPTWATAVGQQTIDNQLLWYCLGPAAWVANNPEVAWTGSTIRPFSAIKDSNGNIQVVIPNADGTATGVTGPLVPTWQTAYGSLTIDNTVTWSCVGPSASWVANKAYCLPTAGFSPPRPGDSYGGASVVDSNNNVEFVIASGFSGGTVPTWNTVQSGTTTDGTVTWFNNGAFSTAGLAFNTFYSYLYSFKARSANDYFVTNAPPGQTVPLGPPTGSGSGHVSTASPVVTILGPNTGAIITVSGLGSLDPQVDTIEIYRTLDGGATYFLLTDILAPTPIGGVAQPWSFMDSIPDLTVEAQQITAPIGHANDPPPPNNLVVTTSGGGGAVTVGGGLITYEFHSGRLWGSVGNFLYYAGGPDTTVGSGQEAWPPANVFTMPAPIYYLKTTPMGLLVFTATGCFIIRGTISARGAISGASGVVFYSEPFINTLSITSYNAVANEGNQVWCFTSNRKLGQIDATGFNEAGQGIGNALAKIDPMNVYLTSHVGDSRDSAVYLSDGSDVVYRLNPNQPPEGGPTWSLPANIVNGVGFIGSLYTSLGVRQLLISQGEATSNLLARNLDVWTDNGSVYPAWTDIGVLVLAQPGQLAESRYITIEAKAGGTEPILGVLLDELTGPFDSLINFVNDPPKLNPSNSIFSLRYWLNQSQSPVVGRNMQIKVTFNAENFESTLYTLSLASALRVE